MAWYKYGMVRYGYVTAYGMVVWQGTIWYSMVRLRYGMEWYCMVWHSMLCYGMVRCGTGAALCVAVRCGVVMV